MSRRRRRDGRPPPAVGPPRGWGPQSSGSTGPQTRGRRSAAGLAGQPGSLEADLDKPSHAGKPQAIEDLLTRLPRRAGPKGEPAARAGPSRGHGSGAQRPGPKGETRGHGGPGRDAVNNGEETWDASAPSQPHQNLQHRCGPAGTGREVQPLQMRCETGGGGATRAPPSARAERNGSAPAAQGILGPDWRWC